jgi:hypothetical protein
VQRTNRLAILIELINRLNPRGETFTIPSGNGCTLHSGGNKNNLHELVIILFMCFVFSPLIVFICLSYSLWKGYEVGSSEDNRIPLMAFGLGIINLLLLSGLVLVLTPFFSFYTFLMFWKTIYIIKFRWVGKFTWI